VRVGLLLEQCLAPVPGGTGRYSRELMRALSATAPEGSDVEAWTAWHRAPLRFPQHQGAVEIARRRLPLPRRALIAAWERGVGPGIAADVVHAPTPLHPPRRHRPLVVTVHDAVAWTYPETLTPRGVAWHRTMIARATATADLLVVPTQAVADELGRHVALRDVLVVGEGVCPHQVLPADADERAARLQLPERYLLTVGSLEPRKGLRELAAVLDGSLPLLCAGPDGWGDGAPLSGARLLGHVSDPDLAVLLSRATALVVPSHDEGFGLPLLEGMSLGTPVLTSDAPALVEVAGGAALAVPLAELRDGLQQITGDEALRARLRRDGPRRAADFSWVNAAETLWRAYLDLSRTGGRQA
jgi:glycosyltransferase involved in cell wall biosynthesis